MDTHCHGIRTDLEIYLPGEAAAKEEDGDSADDIDEGEPMDVTSGVRREAGLWTRSGFPRKLAETTAQGGQSTAARGVIDDCWPGLTLIDAPVGEDILTHPYGRHGCLYIEIKVAVDKKPNPQQPVSRLFFGLFLLLKASIWIGHEEATKNPQGPTRRC